MKRNFIFSVLFLCIYTTVSAQNAIYPASATGNNSGNSLTTGSSNNILGWSVGTVLTTGSNNTLIGTINQGNAQYTARYLSTGSDNVMIGPGAGAAATTGNANIAIGTNNLTGNSGNQNTSVGIYAGYSGSGGNGANNSFYGYRSGVLNSTGSGNAYFGHSTGSTNTTGTNLTFIGTNAGATGTTDGLTNATAIGYNAQVTASNSMVLGNGANVGIASTAPTHSLTFGNGAASPGVAFYNTADQSTLYERVVQQYQSNIFTIGSFAGASGGAQRSIQIGVQTNAGTTTLAGGRIFTVNSSASVPSGNFNFAVSTATSGTVTTFNTGLSGTGQQNMVAIQGNVNQSTPTGAYTALLIAPFESGSATGNKYLIDAGTNSATAGGGTHTSKLLLTSSGNMGLGTADNANWKLATSAYKLNVNGGVIATGVTIKDVANWADFVFEKDYKLRKLSEVKAYIDANGHLPEMPSAKQVEEKGLNLGEINQKLTQKVEELTLYLIQKDEEQKKLQVLLQKQQEQIDLLMKKMNNLK